MNCYRWGLLLFLGALSLRAETGYDAWLRYAFIDDPNVRQSYTHLPATIVILDPTTVIETAAQEASRGVRGMLAKTLRMQTQLPNEDCILLGTMAAVKRALPGLSLPTSLQEDGYLLRTTASGGHSILLVTALNDRGVLYGTFALLRNIGLHQDLSYIDEQSNPFAPIRWTNEWNNLDGSIERGYAGRSIFYDANNVREDLTRAGDYARLLASIGINGCTINNVNANPRAISTEFLPQLARIAAAFRPWGIRVSVSVDFSSPKILGHLDTFDPLDPKVAAWWKDKADEIYKAIPDLGGILLKADSEGRVGPSTYGRTHADAANVIAKALQPHGGVLVYRGFVYDHHMDWRNLKNDRARAAYDNFERLDGKFDDNVLVQIKYGPIDFQVREPVSPLIAALKHTNETLELQVTQEYTGQQRQLCFLPPMWKEILDFNFQPNLVKDIVAGKTYKRPLGGFVAVTNVGLDQNWLGYDLAMSNLYAFGRIAWDANLSSRQIVDEWTRLTFGHNAEVVDAIDSLQLRSWRMYENYTGPLGAGGLTDIIGVHYGPGIESSERNGWGQWHRADEKGIGMDRTAATGTGYISQYPPPLASLYESLKDCPDNLLLFMHHVPYTHVLHSGKTVIQHIYDSHYEGAEEAQTFPEQWQRLHGKMDEERYQAVLKKLQYQASYAYVWRDAICNWFFKTSQIADALDRVGHHPDRVEAEAMSLKGYAVEPITPWEDASGSKAIACTASPCTATTRFNGKAAWYSVGVQYFDQNNGASHFQVFVGNQLIGEWTADERFPSPKPNAHTSTRHTMTGIALRPGDEIRIVAVPDGAEQAAIDYLEINPEVHR
ncbi:MAG TPA: alpha-glucuronidase family glycosyl hydrolase [Bryobacteraceae bacterium]|jgi:alpha-glucuronidase